VSANEFQHLGIWWKAIEVNKEDREEASYRRGVREIE